MQLYPAPSVLDLTFGDFALYNLWQVDALLCDFPLLLQLDKVRTDTLLRRPDKSLVVGIIDQSTEQGQRNDSSIAKLVFHRIGQLDSLGLSLLDRFFRGRPGVFSRKNLVIVFFLC